MNAQYDEGELLMLSGIQHFAYCKRQWALIHIEGQWADNLGTVEGQHLHERAHCPSTASEGEDKLVCRGLYLVSYALGLYGRADVVEFRPGDSAGLSQQPCKEAQGVRLPGRPGFWLPSPVEYKRGQPKPDERDWVQLCAQAMCLEEMLAVRIPVGDIFYGKTRRRQHVEFTEGLRFRTLDLSRQMHEAFRRGFTPPAERGKRCALCSLVDLCLPGITRRRRSVTRYIADGVSELTRQP